MFFQLEKFSDACCVIEADGSTLSYAQVAEACTPFELAFSSYTEEHQCKPLVLLLCDNNAGSLLAYLAALRADSAVMLLGSSIDSTLLAMLVQNYAPNYIVCDQQRDDLSDDYLVEHQFANTVLRRAEEKPVDIHSSLSLLLSTSGSTGSPKFVRLSQRNIDANAKSIAEYLNLTASERPITVLPMPYSYGLSIINSHLRVGASLAITEQTVMDKEFWALFTEAKITSLSGVPYTYEMYRRLRIERRDLSALRSMTQAGGKLSEEHIQHFADLCTERDIKFYVMYGQTEASARISFVPAENIQSKCGSIGLAIPGGKLELIAGDGRSSEGELIYSGPNVMLGYAEKQTDLALGDELNGVLHTGDIGRFDDDGYCYITGRLKRIIKMFGNRVNLDDIDAHLARLSLEGISGGEDNLLKIIVTEFGELERVKKSVVSTFKFNHRSVEVYFLPMIPRNDSGKIQYAAAFAACEQETMQ